MSNDIFVIDDRPYWSLSEEEKKQRREEADRILGPERCKQLDKEFAEWKKQNNKLKGEA